MGTENGAGDDTRIAMPPGLNVDQNLRPNLVRAPKSNRPGPRPADALVRFSCANPRYQGWPSRKECAQTSCPRCLTARLVVSAPIRLAVGAGDREQLSRRRQSGRIRARHIRTRTAGFSPGLLIATSYREHPGLSISPSSPRMVVHQILLASRRARLSSCDSQPLTAISVQPLSCIASSVTRSRVPPGLASNSIVIPTS